MPSEYAKKKFRFKFTYIEIIAIISFLFFIFSLTLYFFTKDNPNNFLADNVRSLVDSDSSNTEDDSESSEFNFSGGGSPISPTIIFAREGSREYGIGIQEFVNQGLLAEIPQSGDDSYFFYENLDTGEKLFIAYLKSESLDKNCIVSDPGYSCNFSLENELTIFDREGNVLFNSAGFEY